MFAICHKCIVFAVDVVNPPLSTEQIKQIDSIVNETIIKCKAPGMVLGIWQGGNSPYILTKGYADLSTNRKMVASDGYRVGSLTKTFTATVILQLADEKLINLDDKLSEYITTLPNSDKVTIRQLLAMTAGLPDIFDNKTFLGWVTEQPQVPRSSYDIYYFIATGKPMFEPGTQCKYVNSNYLILGMIIEQITHKTARDAITERVIKKLGLQNTYYPETSEMIAPFAKGYHTGEDGKTVEVECSPTLSRAAGAMVSNMDDLARYVKALYNGTLVSPETNAARQEWQICLGMPDLIVNNRKVKIAYGLGLFNFGGGIGHGGYINGYTNMAAYFPNKDVTIVMAVNSDNNAPFINNAFDSICIALFDDEYPFEGSTK